MAVPEPVGSLQGHLLVASPQLSDPNFMRTVVLMIQHDADGAFGLVLNRPLTMTVAELWEAMDASECTSRDSLRWGGPVSERLIGLHAVEDQAEGEVLDGVYLALHRERLLSIARQSAQPYRVFSGYAGWASGQLDGELGMGGWLHMQAKAEHVFHDGDDLWDLVIREIGLEIIAPALKNRKPPPSADWN